MTLKRSVDVVVAAAAVVFTAPVWAIVAIAVKVTSPGPVFHRASRVGKDGVPFTIWKFRTMLTDSNGPGITYARDARITPVGRLLRRLKIDEIPQLLNVLAGEMSLVGPRPEDPRYVAHYSDEQRRVLSVRPGVTGPAALAYRDEERLIDERPEDVEAAYVTRIMPAKLQIDLEYVEQQSFWLDVGILFRTIAGMLIRPRRSE